jgi:hypothetical protein
MTPFFFLSSFPPAQEVISVPRLGTTRGEQEPGGKVSTYVHLEFSSGLPTLVFQL